MENQPSQQTQSSDASLEAPQPISTEQKNNGNIWKIGGIIAISIAILISLLVWHSSRSENENKNLSTSSGNDNQQNNMEIKISLLGNTYKKGFTLPANTGTDYTSESYEWVKNNETVENWKTLITTHKLSPISADKLLIAAVYAQNVATLQTNNGAMIIETSVINTEDAAKEGVDVSNPPYLLVYAFPSANKSEPTEFIFQKIENIGEGKIVSFIYAERIQLSSKDEIKSFVSSPSFSEKRAAVLLGKFPY